MRTLTALAPIGLSLLVAAPALAQSDAAPAPEAAETAPPAADDASLAAARAALSQADTDRLTRDHAYAGAMLGHLDRLAALPTSDADLRFRLDLIRLVALSTLERKDEAGAVLDRALRLRPRDPHVYGIFLFVATRLQDRPRAVAAVEAASRDVAGVGWRELRQVFDRATMGNLLYELKTRAEDDLRVRLARALFAIGWPGGDDAEAADSLRLILADDRLDHDDRDGAAGLVSGITTPGALLSLIVRPRYDTILAPGEDRLALLERVLAEADRTTAAALARDPRDPGLVLARAQYLRGIGRNAEALDLLRPFLREPRDTVTASEQGLWLVNEAAYALIALGRNDQALRLMRRLAALPTQENAQLIGARINYSLLLWDTGHYDDALERAARLERDAADMTSAFGRAWIASASACALARLGRVDEAAARISDLRAESTLNPDALMRAYLCTGDADAAAALMVERLGGDDPVPAILSLQHYQSSHGDSQTGPLYDALGQIGARPDVQAALDRVGRVLTLPLARTRWGDF